MDSVALLDCQQMAVAGDLERCIRVLAHGVDAGGPELVHIPTWRAPECYDRTDPVTTDSCWPAQKHGPSRLGTQENPKNLCVMLRNLFRSGAGGHSAAVMGPGIDRTIPAALAQGGTPGLIEFRWDSDPSYRKLYYFQTSTLQNDRSSGT